MGDSQPVSDQPVSGQPAVPDQPVPKSSKEKALRFLRGIRPFVFVILIVLSFRSTIADWNDVPTGSMKPSILEGDRIFVNKLAYDLKVPFTTWHLARWDDPQRGDVIVFFSPQDGIRLVKRVIGVPGDVIDLRENRLFVNGQPADYQPLDPEIIKQMGSQASSYLFRAESINGQQHPVMQIPFVHPSTLRDGPITIKPGQYFVMGDNRDNSNDSRAYGTVSRDQIVGRASRIVLSVDPEHHYKPRWDRFFMPLP